MGWEFDILNGIQSVFQSDLMDQIMPAVTALGNGGIFWIAAGLVFTSYKKTRTFGICILTALVFEVLSCNVILKPLVARPRPFTSDPARILLIPRPEDYSFPSGHTAVSFAAASAAWFMKKRKNRCGFWGCRMPDRIFETVSVRPLSDGCIGRGCHWNPLRGSRFKTDRDGSGGPRGAQRFRSGNSGREVITRGKLAGS